MFECMMLFLLHKIARGRTVDMYYVIALNEVGRVGYETNLSSVRHP